MRLITVSDDTTGTTIQRIISPDELASMSGVELAALLFPDPTDTDIASVNEFLTRYRSAS